MIFITQIIFILVCPRPGADPDTSTTTIPYKISVSTFPVAGNQAQRAPCFQLYLLDMEFGGGVGVGVGGVFLLLLGGFIICFAFKCSEFPNRAYKKSPLIF